MPEFGCSLDVVGIKLIYRNLYSGKIKIKLC